MTAADYLNAAGTMGIQVNKDSEVYRGLRLDGSAVQSRRCEPKFYLEGVPDDATIERLAHNITTYGTAQRPSRR